MTAALVRVMALHQEQERTLRRLVVINRDKRLVGIISLGDLVVEAGDEKLAGKTLEQVSEPAGPKAHERPTPQAKPEAAPW